MSNNTVTCICPKDTKNRNVAIAISVTLLVILIIFSIFLGLILGNKNRFFSVKVLMRLAPSGFTVVNRARDCIRKNEPHAFALMRGDIMDSIISKMKPVRYDNQSDLLLRGDKKAVFISNHLPSNIDFLYLLNNLYEQFPQIHASLVAGGEDNIKLLYYWIKALKWCLIHKKPYSNDDTESLLHAADENQFVVIYPEGAVLKPKNFEESEAHRLYLLKKKGLKLKSHRNVVLPRPRGLHVLLNSGKFDTLYDYTTAYLGFRGGPDLGQDDNNSMQPSLMAIANRDTSGGIVYDVEKIDVKKTFGDKPTLDQVAAWLNKKWDEKEAKLDYFAKYQRFPPRKIVIE